MTINLIPLPRTFWTVCLSYILLGIVKMAYKNIIIPSVVFGVGFLLFSIWYTRHKRHIPPRQPPRLARQTFIPGHHDYQLRAYRVATREELPEYLEAELESPMNHNNGNGSHRDSVNVDSDSDVQGEHASTSAILNPNSLPVPPPPVHIKEGSR